MVAPLDDADCVAVVETEGGGAGLDGEAKALDFPARLLSSQSAAAPSAGCDSNWPPMALSCSIRVTRAPERAALSAAASPAGPLPITATSANAYSVS